MKTIWPNKIADNYLREWYSDCVKVDPACLGFSLNVHPAAVEKRLRELKLKKCASPGLPRKESKCGSR